MKTVLGFLCLWIVVAGFLGQQSFSQQPTPPTSLTFEDFKAKWEQTDAERVHADFVLKETQDGQDSEFVVKIGDRRAGTSVPIKIALRNELAFPVAAATRASCGCAAGVPSSIDLDSNQSRDFLILYKVPTNLGAVSASIYCSDPDVRVRFAIHIAGNSVADFQVSESMITLDSDEDTTKTLGVSPLTKGTELGEFEIRAAGNASFVKLTGIKRKEDGAAIIEFQIGRSENNLLEYSFDLVHLPSQIGVPIRIRYINRIQSFPRVAAFRDKEGERVCRLLLKGGRVKELVERPNDISVFLESDGDKEPCTLEVSSMGEALSCTLRSKSTRLQMAGEKAFVTFHLNDDVMFTIPCFWME